MTLEGLLGQGVDAHLLLDARWGYPAEEQTGAVSEAARERIVALIQRQDCAVRRFRRTVRAQDVLRKLRPDVIHFLSAHQARRRVPGLPLGRAKVMTRFSRYDAGVTGLDEPGYFDPLWEYCDMVEVFDEAVLARLRRRGCPSSKPAVIVPFPVLTGSLPLIAGHREHRPDTPLRVLSAGPLEWPEGLDHAAHAIALLRTRGLEVRWRVVGEGPYLSPLLFACRQLGIEDRTSIVTPDGPAGLQAHLGWTDVLLAPGLIDGLAPAIAEALANAVAVVMTDAGELGELAIDGRAVIEVPRRDPWAIANAIESLAHDSQARIDMGAAGRSWAAERFGADLHLRALAAAYRELLGTRPPPVQVDARAPWPGLEAELSD